MPELSDSVRVTARLSPLGAANREFGIGLYLHRVDEVIEGRNEAVFIRRTPRYTSATDAADDDGIPSAVDTAIERWFGQSPFPRNLQIGTMVAAAQPSYIFSGGSVSVSGVEALGDGVSLTLDGNGVTANFDTLNSMTAIASALQAGIRAATGIASRITGIVGVNVTNVEALGNSVALDVNGNDFTANFDGVATIAQVATALQTGIRNVGAYSSVNVTAAGTGLVLTGGTDFNFGTGFEDSNASQTLGLSGNGVIIQTNRPSDYAAVTVAADDGALTITGTNSLSFGTGFADSAAARELGLDPLNSNVLQNFPEAETVTAALNRIEARDPSFYWVAPAPEISESPTDVIALRSWVASRGWNVATIIDLYGEDVLVSNETTSLGAQLSALGGNTIGAIWNGASVDDVDLKGLSYMARFSSINFNAPNAVPNGKFLQLPGTTPRSLNASERAELRRKRINFYGPVLGQTAGDTEEGYTFGTWIDTTVWIAWFVNALQVAGYNHLKSSSPFGGVPITDQGLSGLADALEEVCDLGVRNGGLAPNEVSPAFQAAIRRATGNEDFDGFLSTGYLVVRPSAAQISQAVRDNRGPIPMTVFAKGAGKINNIEIGVDFEQ